MTLPLDEIRSQELAQAISSKARKPFDNAYRGALKTQGALYVQGFLVIHGKSSKPIEHAWLELDGQVIDPSFPFLNQSPPQLHYFPAQRLTVQQLKAAIEEAREDYPEDDPLPIYGTTPYEYYGDVMLGGAEYQVAYQAAEAHCRQLFQRKQPNS